MRNVSEKVSEKIKIQLKIDKMFPKIQHGACAVPAG